MKKAFWATALVYFLVFLINDGFMASDEYWTAMTRYLPAQTSSLRTLVQSDDVKSPLQILPMHATAQLALKLGMTSAYAQYRFVIVVLGLINLAVLALAIKALFPLFPDEKKYYWLLFGFYFAAPFVLTRPMFESLAAPWLALAAAYGLRYDRNENLNDLLVGTFAVSVAFVLRQQVGVCALGLVALPLIKKNFNHFWACAGLGGLFLILSGIPDYFIRGQFHYSLLAVTTYNFEHGQEYGNEPWTYYPLMILALTLSPFFIMKYPTGFWRNHLRAQRLNLIFIFLFVFLHSLFPQKFERFLISILPLLIFFMAHPFRHLYAEKVRRPFRWYSLLFVNFFLFIPASFSPAQKNIIGLARFFDQHPQFNQVLTVNETLTWIPEIFVEKSRPRMTQISEEQLPSLDAKDCSQVIVVNSYYAELLKTQLERFRLIEKFPVNYIEDLAYRLNKKNNLRRTPLLVYGCAST